MLKRDSDHRKAWIRSMLALAIVAGSLIAIRCYRDGANAISQGGATYRAIAANLVEHGLYSVDGEHATGYRPPAYPLLLAGIQWIAGHRAAIASLAVNLAMDAACLALLLLLVDRLSRNPRAMLLAGVVFATDVAFHLEAMAQRETMLYTLLLLAFFLPAARRDIAFGPLLLMACLGALAWLTRPTGVALIPLLLIAAFFQTHRRAIGLRLARAFAACCVFAAIVLPWQMQLYRSFHEPVLTGTTSGGLNLYQGNNPAAETLIPWVDVDAYLPTIEQRLSNLGIDEHDELARDRRLKADAIAYIRSSPLGFVRRAIVKVIALYYPVPTPLGTARIESVSESVELKEFRYHASVWTLAMTVHGLGLLCMLAAAMWRWKQMAARRPATVTLMTGYLLLATMLHAVTFAETRFRLPLDPLMIALGATAIFQRRRSGALRMSHAEDSEALTDSRH